MTPDTPLARALARAKLAGALLAPHGYYVVRDEVRSRRTEVHRRRNARWRDEQLAEGLRGAAAARANEFSIEAAIAFLVARGLAEPEVRDGSMNQADLDFAAGVMRAHLPRDRPIRGLQVGNFVGVSLAYLSATLRSLHPDSVVVSIDPNIPHRRIENPLGHVLALLGHFDLLASNAIVTGYSLEQSLGDNPTLDATAHVQSELACEGVLESLGRVAEAGIDVALLDGNHTEDYLAREMAALRRLLAPGALLIVDDVDPVNWAGVVGAYERAIAGDFEELGREGRMGVLRVSAAAPPEPPGAPATGAPSP